MSGGSIGGALAGSGAGWLVTWIEGGIRQAPELTAVLFLVVYLGLFGLAGHAIGKAVA